MKTVRKPLLIISLICLAALPAVAAPTRHHRKHHAHTASGPPPAPTAPLTWPAQIALLRSRCDPSVTPQVVWRLSQKSSEILAAKGIQQSPFSILVDVNKSIPAGIQIGKFPQDMFAAYITLRVHGESSSGLP